jgi:ATP:ADP antiporter, AAA family
VSRLFDIRPGEARDKVIGFAVLQLLIIGAHTILETARDSLLLAGPGPRALGFVYMAIAAGTVPGAAIVTRAGERFGQRRALIGTLLVAVLGPLLLSTVPTSHAVAMATYVLSGILGSIVVPQFWTLLGTVLTVSEGRRLFGLISVGGVLGGVLGPLLASAALVTLPVRSLLPASSIVFATALGVLLMTRNPERARERPAARVPLSASLRAFRETPFLIRVAGLVLLSTATFLFLDYLFKSTLARTLPSDRLPSFIAHYYLVLNGLSLLVQLSSGSLIRYFGVLPSLVPTPLLLLLTGIAALAGGVGLPGVLLLKATDGGLRYSLHRVTEELIYLPVSPTARQRTKPLIDGGLVRLVQTMIGAGLLFGNYSRLLSPRLLNVVVMGLAAGWLALILTMRRPYLELLRRAVSSGSLDASENLEPLDLETGQLLVQALASEDAFEVESAIVALSKRGRPGFVPALVLLHRDEGVLLRALELFGESDRSDWFALARRLLDDPREAVRVAAARALARHEQLDPSSLASDAGWRARGYAAVRMAVRDDRAEIVEQPYMVELLALSGENGVAARLGMLAAVADAARTHRLSPLIERLASSPPTSREETELLARAIANQREARFAAPLVDLLAMRDGREAVRAALVELGSAAFEEALRTMKDASRERRLRLHLPKTVARFATQQAANALLEQIEAEQDGLVRYKCIRALLRIVTEQRITVDRARVERLCAFDLEKYFRHLAFRQALCDSLTPIDVTSALLDELLKEKARHALERAFKLLQVAHPRQGVHHSYVACRSGDPYVRANAAELINALLRRRDQKRLRELFHLATDDLSSRDRVARARLVIPDLSVQFEHALEGIRDSDDPILAAISSRLDDRRRLSDSTVAVRRRRSTEGASNA